MRARPALLLGCLLAALACKKSPGPPSAEWERARALHVDLVARYADEAYGRPEMDEVLSLLGRVPPDSVDAPDAAALQARVVEERKRLAQLRAERERMLAAAGPGSWSPPVSSAVSAASAAPAKPPLQRGLALETFREAYGDCFEHRTLLEIEGPDGGVLTSKGEAWGLKADPSCKDRYPEHADKVVLFAEAKLLAVRPASDVKVPKAVEEPPRQFMVEAEVGPDGGLVPKRGPDGGYVYATDGGR